MALETNLIRAASPASIYNGVKKAANDAVVDGRAVDSKVKLSVSVQADVDIDLNSLPANVNPTIKYFVYLGLVDINLQPKPSLTVWDGIFSHKLAEK